MNKQSLFNGVALNLHDQKTSTQNRDDIQIEVHMDIIIKKEFKKRCLNFWRHPERKLKFK